MNNVPDLKMKPLTERGRRILAIQAKHAGECLCVLCQQPEKATKADLRAAEKLAGITYNRWARP